MVSPDAALGHKRSCTNADYTVLYGGVDAATEPPPPPVWKEMPATLRAAAADNKAYRRERQGRCVIALPAPQNN